MMQPFNQTDNHQRMTAEFKEVVMTAHLFHAQQRLPNFSQGSLSFTDWCFIAACDDRGCVWLRQRLTIQFTVRGQRECFQYHIGAGQHIAGKILRQLLAQFSRHQLNASLRQDIGNQTFLSRYVFMRNIFFMGDIFTRQHYRFTYPMTLHQSGFDFSQFNTEAAQFDLKIIAAEVFEIAVR
ncbi:hypothetical protein Xcab_04212 [Xenorhabdus cabanillasii JM26]|nr:hypothetical protein Xcab_04212 [Xenorhabdus cabanillasii JM26]